MSHLQNFRSNLLSQIKQAKVEFQLDGTPYKYERNVGSGTYGTVCSAVNTQTGERVAIKLMSGVFAVEQLARRAYREIKILRHVSHPNIVSLRGLMVLESRRELYLVLDFMPIDLRVYLRSQQQIITLEHIRFIFHQLMCGLSCLHSIGVAHRDLKPSNLLIDEHCRVKICDFGMARHLSSSPEERATVYVATRWYRSPELLRELPRYTTSVDMWSAGCLLGELLLRRPLFPADRADQMVVVIASRLGPPPPELTALAADVVALAAASAGAPPLSQQMPQGTPASAVDLLGRLLRYEPTERLGAEAALRHSFLTGDGNGGGGWPVPVLVEAGSAAQRQLIADLETEEALLRTCKELREAIKEEARQVGIYVPLAAAGAIASENVASAAPSGSFGSGSSGSSSTFVSNVEDALADRIVKELLNPESAAAAVAAALSPVSPASSVLSSELVISPPTAAVLDAQPKKILPAVQIQPDVHNQREQGQTRSQVLSRLREMCLSNNNSHANNGVEIEQSQHTLPPPPPEAISYLNSAALDDIDMGSARTTNPGGVPASSSVRWEISDLLNFPSLPGSASQQQELCPPPDSAQATKDLRFVLGFDPEYLELPSARLGDAACQMDEEFFNL